MNMTGEKLTRWFRIGVIGNWAAAGRHVTDANVARRFWDDMRTAFAEMDIIPKDLTRVNAKMDHLDPGSDAYKALGCRLSARQKDWDEACRRFKSAQAAFSAYVRVKSASIDRSENIREDLEARLQRIRERIDKLSHKTE